MPSNQTLITGLGVVSAIGLGREAFWDSLRRSSSAAVSLSERTDGGASFPEADPSDPFWRGVPVIDFDPKQYVKPRKALKVMCREIQTAFAAAQLAIDDAGISSDFPADNDGWLKPDRVGTVFGCEMLYGPPEEMTAAIQESCNAAGEFDPSAFGAAAMKKIMPLWMLKYLPNMPACQVGIAVNARGPNNSLVLGDVSGPSASAEAVACVRRGLADVMVCGATGTRINTTRLNYRHDYPVSVIGGEGSVVMLLEPSDRVRDDRRRLATWVTHASRFVPSAAMRSRARSASANEGAGRGSPQAVEAAVSAALAQAGLTAGDLGLIVDHRMGDPSMDQAMQRGLSGLQNVKSISPIKSIGHTGAASGMFQLATGVAAIASGDVDAPVLCVCHTSEGSATAVILAGVQR